MPLALPQNVPMAWTALSDRQSIIQYLTDQVSDLAQKLALLNLEEEAVPKVKLTPNLLRMMLNARRARATFFPDGFFADPAWDMLLDLSMAHLAQVPISVSSLCIASNVPPTTALRWIKLLEKEGFVLRRADPLDGRRFFVGLTLKAENSMRQYFSKVGFELVI